MTNKGDPKRAITYAQRQLKDFEGKTDSQSAPATKVHLLVQELAKYLPPTISERYL